MEYKRIAIIAAAAVALFAVASFLLKSGVPVKACAVESGPLSAYVEERAKTTLPSIAQIVMPFDGRLKPLELFPGAKVAKGQTVAEIDLSDLKTASVEETSRLESLQAKLKLNQYNEMEKTALNESADWIKSYGEVLAASSRKAEAAKARQDFAKWRLSSVEKMASGQAVSERELYQVRMEWAEAEMNYDATLLTHSSLETLKPVVELLPVYIKQFLAMKGINEESVKAEIDGARAALEKARRDMELGVMKAPFDGFVLKRYQQSGRQLSCGAPILDIGDLSLLQVTAEALSQEAVRIRPGNPVDIFGAAIGEAPVKGKVLRVDPEGFTKVSSLGVEEQRVNVVIVPDKEEMERLAKEGRDLGCGFRVQVKIYTASVSKALVVPRIALFRGEAGKWKAFKAAGSRARLVDLEIGLVNELQAQALKGLSLGDKVILAPPASLRDGSKIDILP